MVIQNKTQISLAYHESGQDKLAGSSVQSAKDGKSFGVVRNNITMDCAVQQDIGSSTVYTEAEAKQLHMGPVESEDTGVMSPSEFISRSMTGEDASVLSDEETPLEEYTSSQLERAVSRVKEQRTDKRQAVERQVENEREEKEALEKNMIRNIAGAGLPEKIHSQLEKSDLPVTGETVARLTHAVELLEERQQMSQDSMRFFIGNEWDITPENINGSIYGGMTGNNRAEMSGESSFDAVKDQVQRILQKDGIAATEEAMETAKWLYDNELSVTGENIQIYQQLEELKEMDTDTLLERITDNLVDGISPEKADLMKISRREAGEGMYRLLNTGDEALRQVYPAEIDFIAAKRQMEEIRLSMTADAARAMAVKGIDLDVSNLEQIVSELRVQEQQAKESWLIETGLPVTEDNAELLSGTVAAAKNVLAAPINLLARSMQSMDAQTLQKLSDSAIELKEQYDRLEKTYEAVGTEVRHDLGDSIRKAFGNINDILNDLGLETTAVNQRAVRILGYNRMDLTVENIEQMKAYDDKITTLMNQLKPQIVAELIRRDINPLEISIDELNDAVQNIRADMEIEDISFRKFMWKMDHRGDMSSEERQSMIGIYRLLDKIEKSDGAVIGRLVKEGRDISLSSLLSATRTSRAEGMDVQVDDDFGGLENIVTNGTSIDKQIMAAYHSSTAGKLRDDFSPTAFQALGDSGFDMSLEKLLEEIKSKSSDEEMKAYYDRMAQDITTAMEDPDGKVLDLLESLQLPDSVANRRLAQSYLNRGLKETVDLWKEDESDTLLEIFEEPERLEAFYDKIDAAHEKEIAEKKESDDISYDDVISFAKMAGEISFYRRLRNYQTYEVPIVTEQGITACNVTIQNDGQAKGTVDISVWSEYLGNVQATFRVSEKHVRGFVTAEKEDHMSVCQQILDGFEETLKENGFTVESDSLIQGNRRFLQQFKDTAEVKNQDLYQVAKCFIVNVAGKDERI